MNIKQLDRMLISCLVDPDFLETGAFYARAKGGSVGRGGHCDLAILRERLGSHVAAKRATAAPTPLNALRAEILDHAAARPVHAHPTDRRRSRRPAQSFESLFANPPCRAAAGCTISD